MHHRWIYCIPFFFNSIIGLISNINLVNDSYFFFKKENLKPFLLPGKKLKLKKTAYYFVDLSLFRINFNNV